MLDKANMRYININDDGTFTASEPEQPALDGQQSLPPEEEGLYGRTESAAGFAPWAVEAYSRTIGQATGVPESAQRILEDRKGFEIAKNDFIRAMSLNKRYPVSEINRLIKESGIDPSAWNSPDAMRADMRALNSILHTMLADESAVASDPNATTKMRQDAKVSMEAIGTFIKKLGVPEQQTMESTPENDPLGIR
jgi:hypothetical protein